MAKRCAQVADVPVDRAGSVELRMIEGVECLDAEQEQFGLRDWQGFGQGHVVIVDARPVEESAAGVSGSPHSIHVEQRSVEIELCVFSGVVVEIEGARSIVRQIDPKIVDAVWLRAE